MVGEFRRRRGTIVPGLNEIRGLTCLPPAGAFYAWCNITALGLSSDEVAQRLLDEAGVACLSGAGFGQHGEGYVRLSYANSMESIEEALYRLEAWCALL